MEGLRKDYIEWGDTTPKDEFCMLSLICSSEIQNFRYEHIT